MSGGPASISRVTVQIFNFNHPLPDDVDMLLVGPTGTNVILMADVGGTSPMTNVTLTFDDGSPAAPDSGPMVSAAYHPTNIVAGDGFLPPAPGRGRASR